MTEVHVVSKWKWGHGGDDWTEVVAICSTEEIADKQALASGSDCIVEKYTVIEEGDE